MEQQNAASPVPQIPHEVISTDKTSSQPVRILYVGIALTGCVVSALGGYIIGRQSLQLQPTTQLVTNNTPTPIATPLATVQFSGKNFSLLLPAYWQPDATYVGSPQMNEEVKFVTTRKTNKQAGGDYTPGTASLTVAVGSEMEVGFFELEANPPVSVTISNYSGEQKNGYTGIAGSVFVVKTIVKASDSRVFAFTLTTQDEDLKNTFVNEYNSILTSVSFLN